MQEQSATILTKVMTSIMRQARVVAMCIESFFFLFFFAHCSSLVEKNPHERFPRSSNSEEKKKKTSLHKY